MFTPTATPLNQSAIHVPMPKSQVIECPRCWVAMDVKEEEIFGPNIEIDICPKCNGIWLDSGELKKVLKDREVTDYLTKYVGTKARSPLICPRCRNLMDIEVAEDIETDVCLKCRGVWLDAGEMDDLKTIRDDGLDLDQQAKMDEKLEEALARQRSSRLTKFFKKMRD